MSHSFIKRVDGATSFVGRDSVMLHQAMVLKHGLSLYARTRLKPGSRWTPTAMLATASRITHKTYKRGQYQQAITDLEKWIAEMTLALPFIQE